MSISSVISKNVLYHIIKFALMGLQKASIGFEGQVNELSSEHLKAAQILPLTCDTCEVRLLSQAVQKVE